jgi:hypothetical protein
MDKLITDEQLQQTSTIYDRLRRETQEEPKRIYISALAFLHMPPSSSPLLRPCA